ncbi:MAG: STAS-like domain-containing protein [Bacteroidota bacterium]|nr:STAS-like domain-containing protein [Bacteroidota bacterium]
MAHLIANKITTDFLTSSGGLAIGKSIESIIKNDPLNKIEISFSGVKNVTPSFINGAFLYLIDNYGADYFRDNIKVINASAEVAKIISNSVRVYLNRQK